MNKSIKQNTGVILALDITEEKQALHLVERIREDLDAIKVGLPLVLNCGLDIVKKIKNIADIPIIADFKIMDYSLIAAKTVEAAVAVGYDAVVVCGACGPDVISRCIKAASDKKVFVFVEFTHRNGLLNSNIANHSARLAKELGAYGIFAPGTKPERIKELREIVGDLIIACCGIGAQGPEPGSAIKAGADFEIIGRTIYAAENPKTAIIGIKEMIKRALK
jgi:orotidine-5'-phosphate decarboxylase